jgi:hypothetical protein
MAAQYFFKLFCFSLAQPLFDCETEEVPDSAQMPSEN